MVLEGRGMNSTQSTLVKRYAKAFLGVFKSSIQRKEIDQLEACAQFLENHHSWLFLCNLSLIPMQVKQRSIDAICKQYQLPAAYSMLFLLLIQHQRVFLLPDILCGIKKEFMQLSNIQVFTIESSCALSDAHMQALEKVLRQELPDADITCTYSVNPDLIAGLAISSTTLRWEKSVRNDLIALRNSVRC